MEAQKNSLSLKSWLKISAESLYNEFWGEDVYHPILRRLLAFIVDFIVVFAINVIPLIAHLFGTVIDLELHITLIINLTISTSYFAILTSKIGDGQTLGKRVFKIKVTSENGNVISLTKSFLRSLPIVLLIHWYLIALTLTIHNLPFRYILHILLIFVFGIMYFSIIKLNRQGLHDLLLGTQVIQKESSTQTRKNLNLRIILGFALPVGTYVAYWLNR
ncbi:MAG: RDD family protein [Cyclobacteriaceae bacterium]|nr:RDD family protein [Cyclobacteriaceae bacterium]